MGDSQPARPPLSGLRVLEIGHFVAAPFAARILGDLGADIIKIEPPGGDPARQWGEQVNGRSLWWSMHGRNKRSVTLNLKHARAREVILSLIPHCDAVIENFRPGHLAKLGLGATGLAVGQGGPCRRPHLRIRADGALSRPRRLRRDRRGDRRPASPDQSSAGRTRPAASPGGGEHRRLDLGTSMRSSERCRRCGLAIAPVATVSGGRRTWL